MIYKLNVWKKKKGSGDKASRIFYQPLSNILLWIFLNLGVSAIAVGWLMALSSIAGAVLFLTGNRTCMIIGSILFIFAMILDHTDGDVARATKKFSKVGIFLDNVHHTCEELFVFTGMGVYVALELGYVEFIFMGLLTSLLIFILADFKAITFWFCKREVYYDTKWRKFPYLLFFGEFFKEWHPLILIVLIWGFKPTLWVFTIAAIWSILRFIPHMWVYYYECQLYDKENK